MRRYFTNLTVGAALFALPCTSGAALAEKAGGILRIPFVNSLSSIVPDLAESWNYNEDGKSLTFKLRQGVKWHDGKPFTSADVKCTWDLVLGKSQDKLRLNPRKALYRNLDDVVAEGDNSVTFVMKRAQPAFTMLLASAY